MTYNDLSNMKQSTGLFARLIAAAADAGIPEPEGWTIQNLWTLVSTDGWVAAWEHAVATMTVNHNPDIGARDDVITDDMIQTAITALHDSQKGNSPR